MHREQLTHVDNEGAVAEAVKLIDFMQLFKVSVAMATTTIGYPVNRLLTRMIDFPLEAPPVEHLIHVNEE